jgi:hopanoid biosynthesis associated RND transporter like protein HpnN
MLRDKFYAFLSKCAVTSRAWWIIGVAAALTAVSGVLMTRLPILTTREGMVDSRLPVQKRYIDFAADFGAQNQLIILLQGDPAETRAAATDVAAELLGEKEWVKNVFFKIDLETMKKSGLYYLPLPELKKLDAGLKQYRPLLSKVFAAGTWAGVLGVAEIEAGQISQTAMSDKKAVAEGFEIADRFLGEWQKFLETPEQATFALGEKTMGEMAARFSDSRSDEQGFLIGDHGRMKIMFVQQSQSIDNTEYVVPFMKHARAATARALRKHPGVTAGFTGWPVSIEEEIGLIKGDLGKVSIIAPIVIFLIVWIACVSFHRTLLMFVPVLFSVVWNFGVTYFTVGHLNYLTSAFVGILFGLGIDYGVVFVRRFDEEVALGRTTDEAIHNTLTNVGQGVGSGAAATIAAFFAIAMTDQPAFSELGIVAGTGIFCALIASFFVHPALVAHFPPPARKVRHAASHGESRLLRRASDGVLRFPKSVAVAIFIVIAVAITQIPRLRFDYNLNNLLAVNSEAVRVGDQLEKATPYKTQFISVVADNLEQVRELQKALENKPTISSVESISMLLPPDQEEKQELLPDLAKIVESVPVAVPTAPPDIAALRAHLARLTKRVETAQEDAFGGGLKELVSGLEKVLGRFQTIDAALARPGAAQNEAAFEKAFFTAVDHGRRDLLQMLYAAPVTIASLDPQMRERFVGQSGRIATMIFPKSEVWDVAFLDRFVGEVEQAAGAVFGRDDGVKRTTGFAVVYQTTTRMIHRGFVQASWWAAVIIFLLVLVDFRSATAVLLTMFPLATSVTVTLGLLAVTGRQLNMANQLFLPILMGIGIDYGIFMTHRWREPDGVDLSRVVATTGNALWLAAATAIAGFGSLLFAHHRGMISFGQVLVVAIPINLAVAMFGLPAIIRALRLDRRVKK